MGTTTEQATKESSSTATPPAAAAREPAPAASGNDDEEEDHYWRHRHRGPGALSSGRVKTFIYSRGHETTDNSQVDGHIVPVLAKVGGYVTAVLVQDNDSVRRVRRSFASMTPITR